MYRANIEQTILGNPDVIGILRTTLDNVIVNKLASNLLVINNLGHCQKRIMLSRYFEIIILLQPFNGQLSFTNRAVISNRETFLVAMVKEVELCQLFFLI